MIFINERKKLNRYLLGLSVTLILLTNGLKKGLMCPVIKLGDFVAQFHHMCALLFVEQRTIVQLHGKPFPYCTSIRRSTNSSSPDQKIAM